MSAFTTSADDDLARLVAQAFAGAAVDDAQAVLAVAHLRAYPVGAELCRQGEAADTFFLITAGTVALTQQLGDTTRTVAIREAGEFFGEMGLLEGKPRSATATALDPVTVLEVTEAAFQKILIDHPRLALAIVRGLVANVRAADRAALVEMQTANLALTAALDSLRTAQAGLVQKERLERELEIAGQVQRSILPAPFVPIGRFAFAGRNLPARQVGGDLYDVIRQNDERAALVLADVSDKGVQAALFMAVTRTLFLAHAGHETGSEAVVLAVHRGLREIAPDSDMFVTAFYGELDTTSGALRYVRAGHEEPLLVRADGSVHALSGPGRFLGAIDGLVVAERSASLEPGAVLVIFSDGVTDAMDAAGRPFAKDAFLATIVTHRRASADEIADAIVSAVVTHCAGAPLADDLTVLVVKHDP